MVFNSKYIKLFFFHFFEKRFNKHILYTKLKRFLGENELLIFDDDFYKELKFLAFYLKKKKRN